MMQSDNDNRKAPLPYPWYTTPVFVLLLLGLANTAYLAWSHYRNYADLTFNSFCALTRAINCDTVSQSPWSIFLGLPLAYWGLFAYALFLVIFLATLRKTKGSEQLWFLLFLLGIVYALASVFFGWISATKIKAHCILCLVSHATSLALLFFSWIILRRFCTTAFWTGVKDGWRYLIRSLPLKISILALVVLAVCTRIYMPPYWQFDLPPVTSAIPSGLTEEGHPWIGSEHPEITIYEYADYQCFQCGKMHQFLRRLIAEHPETIRLVHVHYPMDHEFNSLIVPEPFHIGSGRMAMIAIYAAAHEKFWEMNDALYILGRARENFNTRTLGEMTGFTPGELAGASRHPQIRENLLHQIRQGMQLGITGTPTYVIDGQVYQGSIPAEVLRRITK
ncbi:vitamin K epoxide reductase/DsbA family protein [Desulfobulbus alkaliphilus]|uniref:vitamin K epoxide reductase/DsbA family protein n=1 Tax=Desulfobulbus alkaliphilus TaxID=869814 RepID=UPI00196593A3|nr:vitamin K epoxide reductase family protein [Desulfobulbus alkaliphilus]MBM9538369.1 thioredoxin domain-containing protein [Desulfobulbus alkaliphilus]